MLGLYIHIPFCNQICPYCDFCKRVSNSFYQKQYVEALLEEMKIKNLSQYAFDTVYIGGGTPSSLCLEDLERLLLGIETGISLVDCQEVTIEVNPEDITEELVRVLAKHHITRISIGIQTFVPRLQRIINRFTTLDEIKKKIALFHQVGICNINIDLMYAIPGETLDDVINDLACAISLPIQHISYYSLILEEHTLFHHLYQKQELVLVDETLEEKMYYTIIDTLKSHQFHHYETSNFSKIGYESKHNLIYWNCESYHAIGTSSSSYVNHHRFTNTRNLFSYINGIQKGQVLLEENDYIDELESMKEEVILGLRKIQGIDLLAFQKKFQKSLMEVFPHIPFLLEEGMLEEKQNHIAIPHRYLYITNHILLKII
ncbi:MAG: radical SAM family heme chaperone HemW [Prevotella sp.]|nr:radical SAM family heme chaperone HemW [Staphylococcus sp.]MCM1349666.1 radical SAM family heme chaperone HemW [Prevotella sp.]